MVRPVRAPSFGFCCIYTVHAGHTVDVQNVSRWFKKCLGCSSMALQQSGRVFLAQGAYRALCEKLAVLHHREFGKFRRLKGRH